MRKLWRRGAPGSHPAEEILLLNMDGELSAAETEAVGRHLRECWQCRALAQQFDSTVRAFMEERRDFLSTLDVGAGSQVAFVQRLRRHAQETASPPACSSTLRKTFRRAWPVALAAAALAAVEVWEPVSTWLAPEPAVPATLVRPRPPLPPALPEVRVELGPVRPLSHPSVPARGSVPPPLGPTAADLDAAEIEAWTAVHRAGLCRGHDIDVIRLPGKGVQVIGVVDQSEQRAALETALSNAPYVEIMVLVPPAEAPAPLAGSELPAAKLEPRQPLLYSRLKQYFEKHSPAGQAARSMNEFANQAVLLAATARWEAQALRKLAVAFPVERLERMAPGARTRALSLFREHSREMERSLAHLGRLLDRLEYPPDLPFAGPLQPEFSEWDEDFAALERDATRVEDLVNMLFAGLDPQGYDAGSAWAELRQFHARALKMAESSATAIALKEGIHATTLPRGAQPR